MPERLQKNPQGAKIVKTEIRIDEQDIKKYVVQWRNMSSLREKRIIQEVFPQFFENENNPNLSE